MVPITWDHPYGNSNVREYIIYRSTSLTGDFSPVATVNLSDRGPLGNLMRDWIDTDVENDQMYLYLVRANLGSELSMSSMPVSAVPRADHFTLPNSWATTIPTIDGLIEEDEWADALKLGSVNPHSYFPVYISIKNDEDHLYIAVDDHNDNLLNPGNLLGILFDNNNDDRWDASAPSSEGTITITNSAASFTGFWGEYPNSLGADLPQNNPPGVEKGVSMASGRVQYEVALDLATSPIKAAPGSVIGFAVWVSDPSVANSFKYGNSFQMPY
ncbi:hypothetical protein GF337_08260, partial [candidate division KSB1 bacterium]|nr:hypothetical protein [candidate division KSB1 bacterium]